MRIPILAAALLLLGPAAPAHAQDDEAEPEARDASECPLIFGDDDTHDVNKERREGLLYGVAESVQSVEVEYRGRWKRPRRFTYQGVDLVETVIDGGVPYALLSVTGHENLDCRDGLYAVGVDDALFHRGRVLAVLEGWDLMLVESHGRLGYLMAEGERAPLWRLSWDTGVRFRQRSTATGGKAKARNNRRTPRKRPKPRRKRR